MCSFLRCSQKRAGPLSSSTSGFFLRFAAAYSHRCGRYEFGSGAVFRGTIRMLLGLFPGQGFLQSFDAHLDLLVGPWQREVDASYAPAGFADPNIAVDPCWIFKHGSKRPAYKAKFRALLLIHGQAYCAVFKMSMLAEPAFVRDQPDLDRPPIHVQLQPRSASG